MARGEERGKAISNKSHYQGCCTTMIHEAYREKDDFVWVVASLVVTYR